MALDRAINVVEPGWRGRLANPDPRGNWLGRSLRLVCEDTKSVFPESEYETEAARAARWTSTVKADFIPLVRSASPDKSFQAWKVPSRLTEDYVSERGSPTQDVRPESPGKQSRIPTPGSIMFRPKEDTQLPDIAAAPSKCGSQSAREARSPVKPATPGDHPATAREQRIPRMVAKRELLQNYSTHEATPSAADWLARATSPERKVIEKVLGMPTRGQLTSRSMDMDVGRRANSSTAQHKTDEFLPSVGHSQGLAEADPGYSGQRLTKLNGGQPLGALSLARGQGKGGKDISLRYIRLLTPKTRKSKWMHQTWHHLPSHHDNNPVNNSSAIYTHPQKIMPRHFVIHPDWG